MHQLTLPLCPKDGHSLTCLKFIQVSDFLRILVADAAVVAAAAASASEFFHPKNPARLMQDISMHAKRCNCVAFALQILYFRYNFMNCMEITVDQMYKIENKGHDMGFLKKFMMENAGAAAVRRLVDELGDMSQKHILVFAGLGNNGGDGLVMARHLAGYGTQVTVMLLGTPEKIKTEESSWNWSILKQMSSSVKLISVDSPDFDISSVILPDNPADVIVDAILGTGILGVIREPFLSAINYINQADCYKFAVDVPSGLNPQTGETAEVCSKCNMTVTFHKMKQGIPKRRDLTGKLFAEKIGIPPQAEEGIL